MGFEDSDPTEPMLIEHKVDEIIVDGEIDQSYNFIDYWFDSAAGRMRARTYLESSREVAIYPPIRGGVGEPRQIGEDWVTRDAVIRYLSRRFLVIKALGLQGYEVVWMAMHAKRVYDHLGLSLDD